MFHDTPDNTPTTDQVLTLSYAGINTESMNRVQAEIAIRNLWIEAGKLKGTDVPDHLTEIVIQRYLRDLEARLSEESRVLINDIRGKLTLALLTNKEEYGEGAVAIAPPEIRGLIVRLLYQDIKRDNNPDKEAFAAALAFAWVKSHREVIAAARNKEALKSMFTHAAYPLPDDLPQMVTLWRGTHTIPPRVAATGVSWTTDRDTACFFAMRHEETQPVAGFSTRWLLEMTVPRTEILYFTNSRNENEAVCFSEYGEYDGIKGDKDATLTDWQAGMQRFIDKKEERESHLFSHST